MTIKITTSASQDGREQSYKVCLPGFITPDEIGFSDVIKRATSYFGIKPCGRYERRADVLNCWLVFNRHSK